MASSDSYAVLRRQAHARLGPLSDPARSRHKPLSLLRLEARRVLEQFLNAESPTLSRTERAELIEDILAEAPGLGPLEDLFRDPAVQEILILSAGQIVLRKGETWTPTSVSFRDGSHIRRMLTRLAENADPVAPVAVGGYDVWLGNGFRLVVVLPPEALELSPTAVFIRGERPSDPAVQSAPGSQPVIEGTATVRVPPSTDRPQPPDPYAAVRQQVTRRIITRLTAAGVHDLNRIPKPELRKIVLAYVEEVCESERLWSDAAFRDRLALEILVAMNR